MRTSANVQIDFLVVMETAIIMKSGPGLERQHHSDGCFSLNLPSEEQ